jgi:dTDP-4-dehydrorhamnose reductase
MQPILVSGASGTLGQAFARLCAQRHVACRLLSRAEMDIADPVSVAAAIERHRPWAIVNASGYVRLDDAETDRERCFRENAVGPEVLAQECARRELRLLTFSSDQVFDGARTSPWLEHDAPAPCNVYGLSKAAAERAVLAAHGGALVVRTSAFFGPWDRHNFVVLALEAMAAGRTFEAAHDVRVSPTYVPDLVNVCLDLLIDGERGIWHLANAGDVSWAELALRAAELAGIDARTLKPCANAELRLRAPRPTHAVLGSARARLMPTLDDALRRCVEASAERLAELGRARAIASGAG